MPASTERAAGPFPPTRHSVLEAVRSRRRRRPGRQAFEAAGRGLLEAGLQVPAPALAAPANEDAEDLTQGFFARRSRRASSSASIPTGRASAPTCAPASTASSPTSARPRARAEARRRRRASCRSTSRRPRASCAPAPPAPTARDLGGVLPSRVGARASSSWRSTRCARAARATGSRRRPSRSSSATTSTRDGRRPRPTYAAARAASSTCRTQVTNHLAGHAARVPAASCSTRCASCAPPSDDEFRPRRARCWVCEPRDAALGRRRSTTCARSRDAPDLDGTATRSLRARSAAAAWARSTARCDRELGREVALKVSSAARPGAGDDERLLREARILARLEHPGIVPVHDVGTLPDGRRLLRDEARARAAASTHFAREPSARRARCASSSASARRWPSPTRTASSTATSSPRT